MNIQICKVITYLALDPSKYVILVWSRSMIWKPYVEVTYQYKSTLDVWNKNMK